jgi:DNA-directed RNA polymerase alpha subunit
MFDPTQPIEETGLSNRVVKRLLEEYNGIAVARTAGQLTCCTDVELMRIPGFGRGSLAEVEAWLAARGVGLRERLLRR